MGGKQVRAEFQDGNGNWIRSSEYYFWFTRQSYKKTGDHVVGRVQGATGSTLTDNTKNWNADEWKNGFVSSTAAGGQVREVTGNTPSTLDVWPDWDMNPGAGSLYILVKPTTWSLLNDVNDDNQSDDGSTSLNWDLQ